MSFKVQVGPPQISIHQGQTVLVTEPDGQINWPSDKGLYFLDTRVISSWSMFANGEPWDLLNGGAITYYGARIFHTNRAFLTEDGPIEARMLGMTLSRQIAGGSARGHRRLQPQRQGGSLQPRDRASRRLRRHLRGEEQPHRPARAHHHRLDRGRPTMAADLPQPRLLRARC